MKIIILGKFSHQGYPLTRLVKKTQEIDTPNGKQLAEVEVDEPLPNIIEVDDAILDQIGKTKCFDVVNNCVIDYIAPIDHSEEIADLKSKLQATDYQAIKYAEGQISESDYAPIKVQRQQWRNKINELEAQNGRI